MLKSTLPNVHSSLSLLSILSVVRPYQMSPLYSFSTLRDSCTILGAFTAMAAARSTHQILAFPTLPHSSSLRMCLTECRVFSTAQTSNKETKIQLQQNRLPTQLHWPAQLLLLLLSWPHSMEVVAKGEKRNCDCAQTHATYILLCHTIYQTKR